jgi:RND family efflux transporter MFP subunit
MKNWMKVLVALLALSLISSAGYLGFRSSRAEEPEVVEAPPTVAVTRCDVEQTVTAPGNLVSTRQATVQMPVDGSLAEVLVSPGEAVTEGQVLARLGDQERFEAERTTAQLALLTAQAELASLYEGTGLEAARSLTAVVEAQQALHEAERKYNSLISGATDEEVQAAKLALDLAKKRLEAAKNGAAGGHVSAGDERDVTRLERELIEAQRRYDTALKQYRNSQSEVKSLELSEAEAVLALARAELAGAEREYERVKAGPDSLEVRLAEAKVADAEAKLAEAQSNLGRLEIHAPYAGVVLEVKSSTGAALTTGSPLVVLTDPQALEITATVIEEDLPYVQVGQTAALFFDALPELETRGTVSRIVPQRLEGDRPLYSIYITLSDVPEELVAGMTADASIVIASAPRVLCLPRSTVRASAGDTALVSIWTGDQEEERTVEVGLRGDVNVEIRSGLQEGDQVVR